MYLETEIVDQRFDSDEACLEWLKKRKYPGGIKCPLCGQITKHHKLARRPCYSCDICGHQVYPAAGTIFERSCTPLRTWFRVAGTIVSSGGHLSARDVQREFGMTYKTAWRIVSRIKGVLDRELSPVGDMGVRGRSKPWAEGLIATHPAKSGNGDVRSVRTGENIAKESFQHASESSPRHVDGRKKLAKKKWPKSKLREWESVGEYQRKRDRTARLLKLQIILWQNPQGLKIEEIVRKCMVSRRTAYRDLKALESELGVPIWEEAAKWGIVEGYFLPPISFTVTEAFNIFIAARLLQKFSSLYNPSLAATLMKINTITPQPLQKQIQNSLDYLERQSRDETKINNLNKLIQAWLSQHQVRIHYEDDAFGAEPQEILIDPYFLEPVSTARSIFVTAFSHLTRSIYSFKLDRIMGDVVVCPQTYEIPTNFNAVDYIDSTWGRYADEELIDVRLHFAQRISKVVTATIWHPSQKLEVQADGSVIATYRIRNTIDFRSWVLGWADEVEVLGPESFRRQIMDIIQALDHVYLSPESESAWLAAGAAGSD
jgi:predicted DNA-binding transcriptional regulator YafY